MRNRIAENGLDLPIEGVINRRRKIGPAQAGEPAVGHAAEDLDGETAALAAPRIDEAHLLYLVAKRVDLRKQAHPLGDVIADPPEIDHVAATAQGGRVFDQHDIVASLS